MIINDNVHKFSNFILFGSFLVYVILFRYLGDVKIAVVGMSAWISLAFIYFQSKNSIVKIFNTNFFIKKINFKNFRFINLLIPHFIFIIFCLIFANEIRNTPGMPIINLMNVLAVIFILCCIKFRYFSKKINKKPFNMVLEYSIYYIIFLGILTGHGVRDSINSHIISYSIAGVLSTYFLVSNPYNNKIFSKLKKFSDNPLKKILIFITFIFLFSFFSFRTDVFEYASPVLHWAYFTGPTYEIAFQNIFSTLSQYSLTFNFLMSKISPNPHFSVWLGQAILLNIVFLMGFWLCRKEKNAFSILFGLAVLILFVDPSSVGPQAYPSSSVVRFFPFYVMIFSYIFISNNQSSVLSKTIFLTSIFLAMIWSTLSLLSLVTSLIMLVLLRIISNNLNYNNLKEKLINCYRDISWHLLLILITTILVIIIAVYTHMFDHQFYYVSTRYGWHSSGSIWVTAPLLFVTVLIIRHILINNDPYAFLLAMPLIASFAYYSYRPLSHNLLAVFPLIFFTLIAMKIQARRNLESIKGDEIINQKENDIFGNNIIKNITISFIIFAVVTFTFQIPNKKETPFSIINIVQNNFNGLSNIFFEIKNPVNICKENEKKYKNFLSEFYEKFNKTDNVDIPFIVLADFFEVSSFGSCFVDKNGIPKQRRIFYTSPLYNDPLPRTHSKRLIKNYLKRHNITEFFVLTSGHNIYSKNAYNGFVSQLPENFKKKKIDLLELKSKYFDGTKNMDISLELMYFGERKFE